MVKYDKLLAKLIERQTETAKDCFYMENTYKIFMLDMF